MNKHIIKQVTENNKKIENDRKNFEYEAKKEGNTVSITPIFSNSNMSVEDKNKALNSNIEKATGSKSFHYGSFLLSQTIAGCFFNNTRDIAIVSKATHDALINLQPADEFEGMLCARLIVLHDQSMHFMTKITNPEISSVGIDMNINRSVKLQKLYNETLEALMKYRRKGEQRVVVQHVNVNDGGQAIVTTGTLGGSTNKK